MHIGYCIGCYGDESWVFTAPLSATRDEVRKILGRTHLMNGEALTEEQVKGFRKHAIGDTEIGWDSNLAFYLEGMNLPEADDEWI